MIYTVGLIAKYDPEVAAGTAVKAGRRAGQHGGWVWRTAAEARAYIAGRGSLATRRVYGVLADWDADTYEAPGEPTRCLARSARVVPASVIQVDAEGKQGAETI